jgi:hypothetical protein
MDKWGKFCTIKCISLSSEVGNIVLWWAFELSSALATAGTWVLNGLQAIS